MRLSTPTRRQPHFWGGVCSLVVLFALVLRVVYVPYHLAQDDHVGTARHALAHVSAERDHGQHGHGHEHDSHDEQAPHSALDHATELIKPRSSSHDAHVELAAAPLGLRTHRAPVGHRLAAGPEPQPPETRRALAARPRGPPTAV